MKRKKVLVIDDDEDLCKLLCMRLEEAGFLVNMAHNEEGFREKAFSEKHDLIILDIMLGEEKGPMVYDRLLREGFDREIPVVFLTSLLEDRPETPLTQGRHIALYGKPVDAKKFVEDIKAFVSKF